LETFSLILQDELDRRRSRLIERRYILSGLDEKPTLQEFDWGFNPKIPKQACFELHTLKFIAGGENALLVGKPGTGKSHIAKSVAYNACLQGYRVLYVEADEFFAQHAMAGAPSARKQLLRSALDADLLVLDDLFLSRAIPDGAGDLLQTIVHKRYKLRRSIVVTTNRVVRDWGAYLGDNTMSTTILDRLMHRSHQLEFEGKSYRLKEAADQLARRTRSG
jgi:DNA replication protein DnaC